MFANLGATLVEMKLKLIIGGIVIALLAGGWFAWEARGSKIDALKKDVIIAKVENGSLKDTADTTAKSGAITEKINTAIAVDAKVIEKKHDKIANKVEAKVDAIDKIFDALPKTPENKVQQDQQTSVALIDGLWESYCTAAPGATECAAPKPIATPVTT